MQLTEVTTLDRPELAIYRSLRDNAFTADNSFIADSPKVVNMLLETDIEVKSLLATHDYYEKHRDLIESKAIPTLYVADKKVIESIIGHTMHHNVMMHGIRPCEQALDALDDQIIMLDRIAATENVGSIARSAAALGVGSYLLPRKGPHPYGRRALRVSMGHVSLLKTHLYDDILQTLHYLKEAGYTLFAAEVTEDAVPLATVKVPEKWVIVMGNEGSGLSEDVVNACDHTVQIEMASGIKSFNVAVAASILMYQFKNRIS